NRIPTHLNCLVIRSQGKTILIDTGLGSKLDARTEAFFGRAGGAQLLNELARSGIAPSEIDIVINTHLHLDHCGGNTRRANGNLAATFPRAEYWIQRLEWADAAFPNERTRATYLAENFVPLGEQVRLIDGDTRVTDEVRCLITRGHTRAHQSVLIESNGKKALFIGDIAGRAVYLERLAWIPAYDVEPLETLETKRRLRAWAVEENILLIFQHEYLLTMGFIQRDGDTWRVEKVE
ncbi:MAG: MBL fold metallo-hydrolase, partial [Chloroflexi bacterium]|nr:MBL fold metallo-hydrolase [Chloroflexota bacterium]